MNLPKPAIDILLVEDNAYEVELTLHAFSRHYPVRIIEVVRDGEEALDYMFYRGRYARRTTPQPLLVLLDIKLPKLDGLEVLAQLKSDARTRCVPVVMLTSSREPRDMEESYRRGVNSYVVKPVDFSEFHEAVRVLGAYWLKYNTGV
jgi:CheY-like chemotaxis protein